MVICHMHLCITFYVDCIIPTLIQSNRVTEVWNVMCPLHSRPPRNKVSLVDSPFETYCSICGVYLGVWMYAQWQRKAKKKNKKNKKKDTLELLIPVTPVAV